MELPIVATPVPEDPGAREQLVLLAGNEAGRAFSIDASVTIGRSADCDISFAGEPSVSRRHARARRDATGQLSVEDLGSRNGTFVNGVPVVDRARLKVGDRLQIGPHIVLLLTREDPLQDLLRERQKMEAIGRMAAGIAHDFNNVVAAALAAGEHLGARLEMQGATADSETSDCLADLRASLERAADLTRSLATLGRRKTRAAETAIEVAGVCEEVLRLCERTFGPSYRVVRRLGGGLYVKAHRTELHQILLNLCLNARDAMPTGGTVTVTVERAHGHVDARGMARGPSVLIRVADTGQGMSEEIRKRVFEPFFTTKREGHGTGLGLATVLDLVTSMNGQIEIESQPGSGSTFSIWLPAESAATRSRSGPHRAQSSGPPSTCRVLLVDDDALVRRSIARILVGAGFTVATAADGFEALEKLRAADPRPQVVVLDLDMPRMSGEETLEHLLRIDPDLRVVVVSGHWDPDRRRALLARGAAAYLSKPFDVATLREALRGLWGA